MARKVFANNQFSWVFLLWYLIYGFLTLLFLFYFNRLIAAFVSLVIRVYTWHYYRVHIHIQSLQISPLAGRVFFKGVRYFGRNETILVQDGYLTWRYWFLRVKELHHQDLPKFQQGKTTDGQGRGPSANDAEEGGSTGSRTTENVPCRVSVKVRGVQWFVYNRSPIYDSLAKNLEDLNEPRSSFSSSARNKDAADAQVTDQPSLRQRNKGFSTFSKPGTLDGQVSDEASKYETSSMDSSASQEADSPSQPNIQLPSVLNILPVSVQCVKAAVVMGSQCTKSILVAKIDKANGQFTAEASAPMDMYRQVINFDLEHPTVQFKHNREYCDTASNLGESLCADHVGGVPARSSWLDKIDYSEKITSFGDLFKEVLRMKRGSLDGRRSRLSGKPSSYRMPNDGGAYGQNKWLGLTRYLDDADDALEQERWKSIEYARVPGVVDCPSIVLKYFWDIPGKVSVQHLRHESASNRPCNINGCEAPAWGIELKIRGGTVNYGPWADRLRADMQNYFFPTLYKDVQPASDLPPGASRVSTALKVIVIIEDQVTLRVPTREDSKDWLWRGKKVDADPDADLKRKKSHTRLRKASHAGQDLAIRPFGWIDVSVAQDSTVNFVVDMLAGRDGYHNRLDADLKSIALSSSVNHSVFWKSRSQIISCDLSNPLCWKALRQWKIGFRDQSSELFILRDHMFLLTDLINDWTSGPPPKFHTFVPFEYSLELQLSDIRLYLNANDSNIIDNPIDLENNVFVILWASDLSASLLIPMKEYRPTRSVVVFDAKAEDGGLDMIVPQWYTQGTFLESSELATLRDLELRGSYNYFTTTSPSLTDVLLMDIYGSALNVHLFGFLIRYFMNIKDNYFGDDIHFRTLEEYQRQMNEHGKAGDKDTAGLEHHKRPTNDLDTILSIRAEKCSALLPAQLYSTQHGVKLEIFSAAADLRITNYYMDVAVSSSPISLSLGGNSVGARGLTSTGSEIHVAIDDVEIRGHRLFGLPPEEPTYMCNWDFLVGVVSGECSVEFLRTAIIALRCFASSLSDKENAIQAISGSVIHDATFLQARVAAVQVALRVEDCAVLLATETIRISLNDWASASFSDRLYALVPHLSLALIEPHGSLRPRSNASYTARTYAYITTTIEINRRARDFNFEENFRLQQEHIALHDLRTKRTPWLLFAESERYPMTNALRSRVRKPAMIFPGAREPGRFRMSVKKHGQSSMSSKPSETSNGRDTRGNQLPDQAEDSRQKASSLQHQNQMSHLDDARSTMSRPSSLRATTSIAAVRGAASNKLDSSNFGKDGISFSSPFKRPHFPLLAIIPDVSILPDTPKYLASDVVVFDHGLVKDARFAMESLDSEQTHSLITLDDGLRATCTPKALLLLTSLLDQVQDHEMSSLLDELQVGIMEDIASASTEAERPPSRMDFRIFVPFLGFHFANLYEGTSSICPHHERYEMWVMDFCVVARLFLQKDKQSKTLPIRKVATHLMAKEVTLSARESARDDEAAQAVIRVKIHDTTLWFQLGPERAAEIALENLEITSASRKVDYISSLFHQTAKVVNDTLQKIDSIVQKHHTISQTLILRLTESGRSDLDLPFLRGASYVLRSAKGHVRMNSSWLMILHLRYVLLGLSSDAKLELTSEVMHKPLECPPDALKRTASHFERVSAWASGSAETSLLLQKIYPSKHRVGGSLSPQQPPLHASLQVRHLRITFDPGVDQNEIVIERCILGLTSKSVAGNLDPGKEATLKTNLAISTTKLAMRLNWSLCELIKNLTESAQATQLYGFKKTAKSRRDNKFDRSELQFAFSSEETSLSLAAINVRAITACRGLKISSVNSSNGHAQNFQSRSLLVTSSALKTEVHGYGSIVSSYNLTRPYVLVFQDRSQHVRSLRPWRTICSGEKATLQLNRTPLEICELLDDCIRVELTYLLRWTSTLKTKSIPPSKKSKPDKDFMLKVHVVVSLKLYSLTFLLLPALTYEINGRRVRASVQSAMSPQSSLKAIVDLGEHSHTFRQDSANKSDDISTLHIPTISGSLTVDKTAQKVIARCRVYTESIELSASSLHVIFNALNQPGVLSLGRDLKAEVQLIQHHLDHAFPKKMPPRETQSSDSTQLFFDVNAVVKRLVIRAATPTSPSSSEAFVMDIDLGLIRLQGNNLEPDRESPGQGPNLQLLLSAVRVDFSRLTVTGKDNCGSLSLALEVRGLSRLDETKQIIRAIDFSCHRFDIVILTETASAIVAIVGHLKQTLNTIELPAEIKGLRKAGRERLRREGILPAAPQGIEDGMNDAGLRIALSLVMSHIRVAWKIGNAIPISPIREAEDLVLSFRKIDLATRQGNAARLLVQDFQLQMSPPSHPAGTRSSNSALLPEVIFNVAYKGHSQDMRFAFHAVGKTFNLRLTSQSILPANDLRRSIAMAAEQLRVASTHWRSSQGNSELSKSGFLSNKKISSLLVYADFAGAVVHIEGRSTYDPSSISTGLVKATRSQQHGKYNQFISDKSATGSATLRSPGVAVNVEYKNNGRDDKSLGAEMKVSASSNTLYPTVVPLIMQISSSIKEIIGEDGQTVNPSSSAESKSVQSKFLEDESLRKGDPSALLGGCKINLGLRICQQDFSLSCQPIARVAARARFEDIYFTVNTVQSNEFGKFFTITAAFTGLDFTVQHIYSRESTADLKIDHIVISFLNSKHYTTVNGLSAILKISPVKAQINAKQMQDFLLFRDIWVPPEMQQNNSEPEQPPTTNAESQNFVIQRYQQIAATTAFPWNAVVSILALNLQVDFGSSIGKSSLDISNFWVSSQKSSDWEQNLCTSLDEIVIKSVGRMSGFIELQNFSVRTLIDWTDARKKRDQTPRVQASARLDHLRVKIGFDFQSFLIMEISTFEFLMYNVIQLESEDRDRLVSLLEGDQVRVFCTATSASQAYSLIQAFQRLIEEKRKAYEASLKEMESSLRRGSIARPDTIRSVSSRRSVSSGTAKSAKPPLRLQTNVVVSLRTVSLGAFPGSFIDNQVFKLEALDISARFAVRVEEEAAKVQSKLSIVLGSLKVALSATERRTLPTKLGDLSIAEVVASATTASGGTILKVPRLVAAMETWQEIASTHIDYVFKSEFQGRVDVGWNYSRVSYIRGMHANHTRSLAQRLGKPLPQSAVQITGLEKREGDAESGNGGQEKITAVVNVPQSKYEYTALQPPIIETPQLRDMGEATPPLEWIGLHRERLPTLTHQVVIVALLEVAQEVDNAYSRILGSS